MKQSDYESLRRQIDEEYHQKLKDLNLDYISKSVPFKVGDIISDGDITIQVEEIIPYVDTYHAAVSFVGKKFHLIQGKLTPYISIIRDNIHIKLGKPYEIKKLN